MAEPDPLQGAWRKSTASGASGCIEVALSGEFVLIRSSRDPSGKTLAFSHGEWAAFTTGVRNGEFDYDPRAGEPAHQEP